MKCFSLVVILIAPVLTFAEVPGRPLADVDGFIAAAPEQAAQMLKVPMGMDQVGKYVQAAMNSERSDLVKICFENSRASLSVINAVAKLPDDSGKKVTLTILMLKSPASLWPPERFVDGPFPIQKPVMDEPFASVIRRMLPGHPLDDLAISTKEKRLRIAAELETAFEASSKAQAVGH